MPIRKFLYLILIITLVILLGKFLAQYLGSIVEYML